MMASSASSWPFYGFFEAFENVRVLTVLPQFLLCLQNRLVEFAIGFDFGVKFGIAVQVASQFGAL
jgi:hypothetical protein